MCPRFAGTPENTIGLDRAPTPQILRLSSSDPLHSQKWPYCGAYLIHSGTITSDPSRDLAAFAHASTEALNVPETSHVLLAAEARSMVRNLALVAAPHRQRGLVCRARDQFTVSPLFRRASTYCDRTFAEWYILSPRHLSPLPPNQVIGPGVYNLHALDPETRADWARHIAQWIRAHAMQSSDPVRWTLFASQRYADMLCRASADLAFDLPLTGLRLGERVRWFDERLLVTSRVCIPAVMVLHSPNWSLALCDSGHYDATACDRQTGSCGGPRRKENRICPRLAASST